MDRNTTVGAAMVSLAVKLSVTSSPFLAELFEVELFEATPTLLSVGALASKVTPLPVKVLELEVPNAVVVRL